MKRVLVMLALCGLFAAPALAALPFHDDFESGMGNWTQFPGSDAALSLHGPDPWKSIDPGPWGVHNGHSARQSAHFVQGAGIASYHNFGPQSGYVKAEAYMFEDLTGTTDPVQGAITLTAQDGGGAPDFAEYLRIGVLQFAGTNTKYSYRTATGGFVQTTVDRKSGWTKLGIEAFPVSSGGLVNFYIDDVYVGSSTRSGADIAAIQVGQNFSNLENFWYDGVTVVPEPATMLLLALGGLFMRRRLA